MLFGKFFIFGILFSFQIFTFIWCQEPIFDIPVQLVGFPVIALSVRFANFAKKLMYSLNPGTYKSVVKRSYNLESYKEEQISRNLFEIKNTIFKEFGENACIEKDICRYYAANPDEQLPITSKYILRLYQKDLNEEERWRLLSAFIGNIIKEPNLCSIIEKELPCRKNIR